jgi:endonuclease III
MPELKKLIAKLKRHYGEPALPPAKGPFELVVWENCCYLLPDSRRAEVFAGLKAQVGIEPRKILAADRGVLLELAKRGGMRPETRVFRWLEIARITIDQFGGALDEAVKKLPYAKALQALKQFPNIGGPGAEKILLYCGAGEELPLDWNGSRVLLRLGFGREQSKNYGAQYKSIQQAVAEQLPKGAAALAQAHLLLKQHGKALCRDKGPDCGKCPVIEMCGYGAGHPGCGSVPDGPASQNNR